MKVKNKNKIIATIILTCYLFVINVSTFHIHDINFLLCNNISNVFSKHIPIKHAHNISECTIPINSQLLQTSVFSSNSRIIKNEFETYLTLTIQIFINDLTHKTSIHPRAPPSV